MLQASHGKYPARVWSMGIVMARFTDAQRNWGAMGSRSEGCASPQTQAAARHFGRMARSSVLKMAFSPFIADHISRLSRYFSVLLFKKPESPEGIKRSPEHWTVRFSETLSRNAFWMKLSALLGGVLLSSHFIPSHLLLLPRQGWRSHGPGQAGRCLSVLGAAGCSSRE